jgi:hypothetical protein
MATSKQMGNSCSAVSPIAAGQQLDSNKLVLAANIEKLLLFSTASFPSLAQN